MSERIKLLHLWSAHHPRDFIRRVEDLINDLYDRVEALEEKMAKKADKPKRKPSAIDATKKALEESTQGKPRRNPIEPIDYVAPTPTRLTHAGLKNAK